jgi:hypothetical protein
MTSKQAVAQLKLLEAVLKLHDLMKKTKKSGGGKKRPC